MTAEIRATISEKLEKKVEKVFYTNGSGKFDAVIYREVDSGGVTQNFLLHIVGSGELVSDKSLDGLMILLEKYGLSGHA